MTIDQMYSDWSTTYDSDRNLTRDLDRAVTRRLLSGVQCNTILEIGCGTGKNTALLAAHTLRLHAVDFSAGMILKARQRLLARNVSFTIANLTNPWPCAPGFADLIACNLVLEHIAGLPFIFSQAWRALKEGGRLFISELHPFRQYQGTKATFQRAGSQIQIPAFVHHLSDFLNAAGEAGLSLSSLKEWWHEEDQGKPPRLVTFIFEKKSNSF
jgi:ubiquinone/menaquinone biosynthesis C-methylase UbiE